MNYLAAKCGVATITTTGTYSQYSPILISFLCRWVESNHRLLLMREAQEAISATATLVWFFEPRYTPFGAYQVVTDTTNPNNVIAESRGLDPIHITANDLFSRQSRRAYPVDSPLVKPSVHQPASPPSFGGADFYKFLTFIHTNIGYDHSPIPGCGLISLMVFMLKLRGELRT